MTFASEFKNQIAEFNLLQHPFYQAWMKGELTKENLNHYAVQYYPHVKAFPRYVSAVHSQCEDTASRRFLLENLNDEEGFPNREDHPELWKQFAEGMGASRLDIENGKIGPKAQELVDKFWSLCRSSYAEGLATLYAYEHQIPEIAKAKISGLIERYGVSDSKTLKFFSVHESADVFHSEACVRLLNELPEEDRAPALAAGKKAAMALWDFLTEVYEH